MEGGGSEGNQRRRTRERSGETAATRITSGSQRQKGMVAEEEVAVAAVAVAVVGRRQGKEDATAAALVKRDIQSRGFVRTPAR